jgi:hypothetical protein
MASLSKNTEVCICFYIILQNVQKSFPKNRNLYNTSFNETLNYFYVHQTQSKLHYSCVSIDKNTLTWASLGTKFEHFSNVALALRVGDEQELGRRVYWGWWRRRSVHRR